MFPGTSQIAADSTGVEPLVADLGAAAGDDFEAHVHDEDFAGRHRRCRRSVEVAAMWVVRRRRRRSPASSIVYQAMSRRGCALVPPNGRTRPSARVHPPTRPRSRRSCRPRRRSSSACAGSTALGGRSVGRSFRAGSPRRAEPAPGISSPTGRSSPSASAAILVGGVALAGDRRLGGPGAGLSDSPDACRAVGRVAGSAIGPAAGLRSAPGVRRGSRRARGRPRRRPRRGDRASAGSWPYRGRAFGRPADLDTRGSYGAGWDADRRAGLRALARRAHRTARRPSRTWSGSARWTRSPRSGVSTPSGHAGPAYGRAARR